jgi:hypothetical protein
MSNPAIPDIISVVGTSYLQPISDLLEKLLMRPIERQGPAGTGHHENGYSAAIVVLLVTVLESYTARLRFVRGEEETVGNLSTPALLAAYFSALPTKDELIEVFLCRNVLAHNHIWHLDVSDYSQVGSPTLATPAELGFQTNKHYDQVVDVAARQTRTLRLNVNPIAVDRSDVRKVLEVVWRTLQFMSSQNYSHTPLAGTSVRFRGKRRQFGDLRQEITDEGEFSATQPLR